MTTTSLQIPTRKERMFLPEHFSISSWNELLPYFEELVNYPLNSLADLQQWLERKSELEAFLEEDAGWRYIKMNIDTTNAELAESFQFFIAEIEPKVAPFYNEFNKKFVNCAFIDQLGPEYATYIRKIKKSIEIFTEENISLQSELQAEQQKFGNIAAKVIVEVDGEQLTYQQAYKLLKSTDRSKREDVYQKLTSRVLEDKKELNELYSSLIAKRHQLAKNAGFPNYRDYMFAEMGRFDYQPKDCFDFHAAIAQEVVPVVNEFSIERKEQLGLTELKPWDLDVDPQGNEPLKPFDTAEELIERTINCLNKVHPYFGERIQIMNEMKHMDLSSKMGKAPGGFNYPLHEIGVPFIYMNAVGSQRDLVTMVHEAGHAVQSFLNRDLALTGFKELTSEVAELASMSMELISMDHWDEFYTDSEALKRAKKEQLQGVLSTLPWVASIDKFQHWVYENPEHTVAQREQQWNQIMDDFSLSTVNWDGHEEARTYKWQKQLHLFEVPFYYIEYGMAQLGAIAVWRNYKQNPKRALEQYIDALSLGYTATIGDIYKTAGIQFDFSAEYVSELVNFVQEELKKI